MIPKFSLCKRGDTYYAQWWENSKTQRVSLRTPDLDRAKRALASFVSQRGIPPDVRPNASLDATVEDIVAMSIPLPPTGSGIYFLLRKKRVVYVGKSVNPQGRVGEHARVKRFDAWAFLPCSPSQMDALERHYIDRLLPELNRDPITRATVARSKIVVPEADKLVTNLVFEPEANQKV